MPEMTKRTGENSLGRGTDRLRLLLVEDSVLDSDLVNARLIRSGLATDSSRVEDEAGLRAALLAGPWDVILVDYTLPGFSGPEAIAICSELAPDVPCIIVTGTLSLEQATGSMRSGVVDCFVKDNISGLTQAVRREVESARRIVEHRRREAALVADNHRLEAKHAKEAMKADRLLRESETLLRAVIDNAPVEIAVFDRVGHVTFVGGKGLEAFGAPVDSIDQLSSTLDHGALDELEIACAQAFEGKSADRIFKVADTGREWEVRFNPVRDLAGNVSSVVAVAVDVTERPAHGRRPAASTRPRPPAEMVLAAVESAADREAVLVAMAGFNGYGASPWL
jgi:PAS domain S-box-containing protein